MEKPTSVPRPKIDLVNSAANKKFEPHDYGNTDDPLSFFGAIIHIIKYTVHVGILALPLVHKRLGYIVGTCLTLITGLLYFHIIHILMDVEYQLCKQTKKKSLTYIEVVHVGYENLPKPIRLVFGSSSKFLMHLCYGIPMSTAIGLIIMATDVRYIAKYFDIEMNIREAINVMIVPTMLLSCGVSKLQMMVPYSMVTNVFSFIIMCIILGYSIFTDLPESSSARPINDIYFVPQCFALLINSIKGTGIYIPVKNEMESPKQFSKPLGVINVTGSVLILLYAIFGAVSYCSYGEELHDNVIVNLSENKFLTLVVYGLYALGLIVNHYLSIYVRYDIYWTSMLKPRFKNCAYQAVGEYAVKLFFNILTYIMAVCMPKYALMAAISGTMGILSDLAVAPLLQLFLLMKDWQEFDFGRLLKIIKNLLIVTLSFVLFASSAWCCAMEAIKLYAEEDHSKLRTTRSTLMLEESGLKQRRKKQDVSTAAVEQIAVNESEIPVQDSSHRPRRPKEPERAEAIEGNNEFEPYDYGNDKDPISFFGAVAHIMKFTIGYGILVVPFVYKNLGYAVAIVLTIFVALLYYHIIHMLVDVEYRLCKIIRKPKLTFLEVIKVGFDHVSPTLRIIFGSIIKVLTHMSFIIPTGNTIGLILMSNMLKSILAYWDVQMSFMQSMNLVFVPSVLLSVFVLKLNFMVPFSALTNIFTFIIMGIVFVYPFFSITSKSSAKPINDISWLPESFSLLVDTFDSTAVFLTVKNEMRTPKQFSKRLGVLNVSASALFLIFTSFGFLGYWNYGDEVEANVLNNIPHDSVLSVAVNALFVPAILVHHCLSVYVRCDTYRESVLKRFGVEKDTGKLFAEYSIRMFFNIFSYFLGVCVPNFSLFATIVGTLEILINIAVIPLLHVCLMVTFWQGCNYDMLIQSGKNIAIICMALVMFFSSAESCIKNIIKLYQE